MNGKSIQRVFSSPRNIPRSAWSPLFFGLAAIVGAAVFIRPMTEQPRRRVGATAVVTEVGTGFALKARVDTGAALCSIHYEAIEITDESPDPKQNVGKPIRLLIKNREGDTRSIESRIVDYSGIQTAAHTTNRYFVHLRLGLQDVEETVVVTLNDRSDMRYPFLVGRNFLRDNFLVDVSRDIDNIE